MFPNGTASPTPQNGTAEEEQMGTHEDYAVVLVRMTTRLAALPYAFQRDLIAQALQHRLDELLSEFAPSASSSVELPTTSGASCDEEAFLQAEEAAAAAAEWTPVVEDAEDYYATQNGHHDDIALNDDAAVNPPPSELVSHMTSELAFQSQDLQYLPVESYQQSAAAASTSSTPRKSLSKKARSSLGMLGMSGPGRGSRYVGKGSHSCKICCKVFPQKSRLAVHMRTHTGERPHGCVHCGKFFQTSSNMRKHERRCVLNASAELPASTKQQLQLEDSQKHPPTQVKAEIVNGEEDDSYLNGSLHTADMLNGSITETMMNGSVAESMLAIMNMNT